MAPRLEGGVFTRLIRDGPAEQPNSVRNIKPRPGFKAPPGRQSSARQDGDVPKAGPGARGRQGVPRPLVVKTVSSDQLGTRVGQFELGILGGEAPRRPSRGAFFWPGGRLAAEPFNRSAVQGKVEPGGGRLTAPPPCGRRPDCGLGRSCGSGRRLIRPEPLYRAGPTEKRPNAWYGPSGSPKGEATASRSATP